MIEVEIRGLLTTESYKSLKDFLVNHGSYNENHIREMILLYDYPGFDKNPIKRAVDIRLRNTNGSCELMIKHKVDGSNSARREISIVPSDNNWDNLITMVKSFGISRGMWMRREKEVFTYNEIEWSLTKATNRSGTKTLYYYEAEQCIDADEKIDAVKNNLITQASGLGLPVWSDTDFEDFVHMLGNETNEEINL